MDFQLKWMCICVCICMCRDTEGHLGISVGRQKYYRDATLSPENTSSYVHVCVCVCAYVIIPVCQTSWKAGPGASEETGK